MSNNSSIVTDYKDNSSTAGSHNSPVTSCTATVNTVEQYLNAIDNNFRRICSTGNCELWYRGQGRAQFNLEPSIARKPINPELEVLYLSKFKSLAIPEVMNTPSFPIPDGTAAYWHWLFLAQHYGVPTRLLDWSLDALVGLYFAVHQSDNDKGFDAAVWVLNPVKLNQAFSFYSFVKPGYIPNVDEEIVNFYFGPNSEVLNTDKPAAVIGPINSPRILAQRGTFTVFPRRKVITPLNLFEDASDYLLKICIPAGSIPGIIQQLDRYGITRFALFPDLCTIADEIKLQVMREGQLPQTS